MKALTRLFLLMSLAVGTTFSAAKADAPSQDDVFRSINQSVNQSTDMRPLLPWLCGGAGLFIVLIIIGARQSQPKSNKPFNHPNRLLREVKQKTGLTSAKIKQLRATAQVLECESPLTPLLCPSLLKNLPDGASNPPNASVLKTALAKIPLPWKR